jgi:hypothetical protein
MGYGKVMRQFGGLGPVEKFEDILEGKGVAALLARDRDGQIKASALAPPRLSTIVEGEDGGPSENDGFLSRLIECTPNGKTMSFKVKTPVNRIPGGMTGMSTSSQRTERKPLRTSSDVLGAIQDASPIERRRVDPNSGRVSTSRGMPTTSALVRQQRDMRVSKARAYLRDDGTVLTAWVSADRASWEDTDAGARLDAILDSFDVAPR